MRSTMLLILAVCIAAAAATPLDSQRIVGGDITNINQYPEIAAVLNSWDGITFMQSCGSTIINTRSILTAAHCLGAVPERYRIRVGSTFANSGGVVHAVQTYIMHPQYNVGASWNNDIAIMHTATAITYGNNVRAGLIAGTNYNLADNQVVWAAGWGFTSVTGPSSETLRHVQIWTVNQAICAARYVTGITENMLCSGWLDVGGRDQCTQDSGGPLYHNGVVVGVCSFGRGCGDPWFPGVNARVSRFTTWIQANA